MLALLPLLGSFGRGWMLARACPYWDTHCSTFDAQFGRSQLLSTSSSSAVWCPCLSASSSSGRRSWALSHQILSCCLRWGYCLHFFTSLRRRPGIVALLSAAAVMTDSDSLRPALIRDSFRAASPTLSAAEGSGTVSSSSNRRSILWVASTALVRAWSIVFVVDSSWRGTLSTVHVSRSSWTPLCSAASSTKREEFLTIGRGWPPTTEESGELHLDLP